MKAINDHIYAAQVSLESLGKGKFWLYLIPSLVVSLFFLGIFKLISGFYSSVETVNDVPLVGDYLETGAKAVIGFMEYITNEVYQFFILTLLSPFNCLLSEKVDNELSGSKFSGGIIRMLTDLLRAVFILIIALFLNLVAMGIWWVFAWITGFHLLDEIIYFVIGAFFIGFSFYDFSLERYQVATLGSISFGFDHALYMLCTGAMFCLVFMIPYVGIIIAPFLMTIISTAVFLKMNKKIPKEAPQNPAGNE